MLINLKWNWEPMGRQGLNRDGMASFWLLCKAPNAYRPIQ